MTRESLCTFKADTTTIGLSREYTNETQDRR
jgi:hypothetical protein